ncbi:MAG: ABC transporter permease [Gemmatimonadetes bacterium]|nr:ABC transporter permease [Gemmatimonadota bacterium]
MSDLRYALRSLARSKGFVAVAVCSLALAIGLNTTVYAVLDAFIHPDVPYRAPDRLLRYAITGNGKGYRFFGRNDRYLFLRERVRFADATAVFTLDHQQVESNGSAESASIADVSLNFFDLLGVTPTQGRLFRNEEEDAAILSDGLWRRLLKQRTLAADPVVHIGARSYRVIGVMPPEMNLPDGTAVWRLLRNEVIAHGIPVDPTSPMASYDRTPQLIARLKPGVTLDRAKVELDVLVKELQQKRFSDRGITFYSWFASLKPDPYHLSQSHWALAVCAFIVLLIACANLANLMLARGIARRGELALRLAIGASRQALIRQLTTEAVVLAGIGGLLGLAWAVWGVSLAVGNLPTMQTFITLRPMHLSWRIFAFALLASGLTTVLVGLLPAIRASDVSLADPLKENAGTTTGRTSSRYSLLAITQVALALTLLMSSAVLVRSASEFAGEDSDLIPRDLYFAWVPWPSETERAARPLLGHVMERIRRIPGVQSAAIRGFVSLITATRIGGNAIADWPGAPALSVMGFYEASADYFRTVGRRIVAGRHFDAGDVDVVIVNETAAKRLWPQQEPIGHSLRIENGPWMRVVGVVEDFRYGAGANRAHEPELSRLQVSSDARYGTIWFRVDGTNPTVAQDVSREVQAAALLATAPRVSEVGSGARLNATIKRFIATLFVFLAICGMGLAALGLYGVLAYTVGRRTREFAVRIALGATNQDVFRLVMHDGTVMFLAGTALGAFIAMFMAQFVNAMLYKVGFTDVLSLVSSELILCGVAFLACLVPARRAMRADPVEILRAT